MRAKGRRIFKKFISIVLVLAMVLPTIHMDAMAEETDSANEAVTSDVPEQKEEQGNEEENSADVTEEEDEAIEEPQTEGEVKEVDEIREIDQMELSEDNESADESEIPDEVKNSDEPEEEDPYIIGEDENQRDEFTKYFRMSDGSFMAAQYPEPIHYLDEEGDYQDYDNSLDLSVPVTDSEEPEKADEEEEAKETESSEENADDKDTDTEEPVADAEEPEEEKLDVAVETSDAEVTADDENSAGDDQTQNKRRNPRPEPGKSGLQGKRYKNKKSDKKVELAQQMGEEGTSVEVEGHEVTWEYKDANKSEMEVQKSDQKLTGDEAFLTLQKVNQSVLYRNIYENVDLQSTVNGTGLKENLILKDRSAQNEFTLEYNIGDLAPVQLDERTINLTDAGGVVQFVISAPVMTDADGQSSDLMKLTIVSQENGKLSILLAADKGWLTAAERVYPIEVDPYFQTEQAMSLYENTYIASDTPDVNYGKGSPAYEGSFYVGSVNGRGKTRGLLKMKSLPQLGPGDMIVKADLATYSRATTKAMTIRVLEPTTDWTMNTATWNNAPQHSNTIIDYHSVSAMETNQVHSWDITRLVKGWYEGQPNYGVMFQSPAESSNSELRSWYVASTYPTYPTARPIFVLNFRNNAGLEDYWSYHTQKLDGGSGHVNDYSGNLVFTLPVIGTTGGIMPAGVNFIYDGHMSHQHFRNGTKGCINGAGWMTNFSQRLEKVNDLTEYSQTVRTALIAQGFEYALIDADGTKHFFTKESTGVYKDEDGLGLTLKLNQTLDGYAGLNVIDDKEGFKWGFLASGYLYKMINHLSQKITLSYSGSFLLKITDGAGRNLNFAYSGATLIKITGPDGVVTFNYNGANLTRVNYPDGTKMDFGYSAMTINGSTYNRLNSVVGRDGMKVVYGYNNGGIASLRTRVSSIAEYATDGSLGGTISMNYVNQNSTVFTYKRSGKTLLESYNFDNFGRMVNMIGSDGSKGSVNYETQATTVSQFDKNNKIQTIGSSTKYVNNLLLNSSMESLTSSGTPSEWGILSGAPTTGSGQVETIADNVFFGKKSLKISQNSTNVERYGWAQNSIPVTVGKTYTFSAYVKTSNVTASAANTGASVYVVSGSERFDSNQNITGTNGWQRISVTFTATASIVRIFAGLKYANGTAWLDCLQFEEGNAMNSYNALENSDFSKSNTGWSYTNAESGDGVTSGGLVLYGDQNTNKNAHQRVYVNKKGVGFYVQGTSTAASVPIAGSQRYYALDVGIVYADGTPTEWKIVEFNPDVSTGQATSEMIAPSKANRNKVIDHVEFYIIYYLNANRAAFDNMMLNIDESGTTYDYDAKGNVISSKENAKSEQVYTLDSATNLVNQVTDEKNDKYIYTYSSANARAVVSAKENSTGIGFEYGYDGSGNISQTRMGKVGTMTTNKYMETVNSYTANGAYITKERDANGDYTEYTVDQNTGRVSKVKKANGDELTYAYNSKKMLAEIIESDTTVYYSYDGSTTGNRLNKINHNGFDYGLEYDQWGHISKTKIGTDIILSSNSYFAGNGNLSKVTYGNGQSVEYFYDAYDRIIERKTSNTSEQAAAKAVGYTYNATGQLARVTDNKNGGTIEYGYDTAGRISSYVNPLGSVNYGYDNADRTNRYTMTFGGESYTTSYAYANGNQLGNVDLPNGARVTRTYDGLGRETVHNLECNPESDTILSIETRYKDLNGNLTTPLVSCYSNYLRESGENVPITGYMQYEYEYVTGGYVSKIKETDHADNSYTKQYEYDDKNQLIWEYDLRRERAFNFVYDAGGNLLFKYTWGYEKNSAGEWETTTKSNTDTYAYGDGNWKDKLTEFNGGAISYDVIGNPLNYRNNMSFTWRNGRQLATATVGSVTSTYIYNPDGKRIGKMVGEVKTDIFTDASGTILGQKTGSDVLTFLYDATGRREGLEYNGQSYYYIYNAQGDVVGIVDSDLKTVVQYTYDAWGQSVVILDGSGVDVSEDAGNLANINPFRYRGYYYDNETGFYQTGSRYYDPVTCRMLNADGMIDTGTGVLGYNMFAYCNNNPTNFSDPTGEFPIFTFVLSVVINIILGVRVKNAVAAATDNVILGRKRPVSSSQLSKMGFQDTSARSVANLNSTLITNRIRNNNEVAHFLAQCAKETNFGTWLTELGDESYFADKAYGYKYRGAGYIQLTWDYNYKSFAESIGDQEIYNQGADYVATNYAWQAAGWWWSNNNMSSFIAGGASVMDVTRKVRGSTGTWEERQGYYDAIYGILN